MAQSNQGNTRAAANSPCSGFFGSSPRPMVAEGAGRPGDKANRMERQMTQAMEKPDLKAPMLLKDADFNWEDPFGLESQLTHEERMVRDTARDYAQEKLFPQVIEAWREERVDAKAISDMGGLGLLG